MAIFLKVVVWRIWLVVAVVLFLNGLAQMGKAINASGLNRKAIVLLLSEMSGVKRSDINVILHNLPLLEKEYLK